MKSVSSNKYILTVKILDGRQRQFILENFKFLITFVLAEKTTIAIKFLNKIYAKHEMLAHSTS